jgi:phosphoenolpyruvate synthase/pyruvate phosphate dikinase
MIKKANSYISNLKNLKEEDKELVGRKTYKFAEIYNAHISIVPSFGITTLAFDDFLIATGIVEPIYEELQEVRPFIKKSAEMASKKIQAIILKQQLPTIIQDSILNAYYNLSAGKSFVSLETSNLINPKFIGKDAKNFKVIDIKGEQMVITAVKQAWASLFSTESIELRTNGYYQGALSIALLIKKMVRTEISGKLYSIPPITHEEDTIEVHAIYGLMDKDMDFESISDSYKYNLKEKKIIEKSIVPQDFMLVRKGNTDESLGNNITVEISKEWRKRQKVDDARIIEIANVVSDLESSLKTPLEITWGFEAGKMYITDVVALKLSSDPDLMKKISKDEDLNKIGIEVHETEVSNKPSTETKTKPDLEKIQDEIQSLIDKDRNYITENIKEDGKSLMLLKEKPIQDISVPRWSKKYKLITDIYLNVSRLNSSNINTIDLFDGTFLDGTELILNSNDLPERYSDQLHKVFSFIDNFALDITTASKNTGEKPLIYQFSNISEYEYKLLGIDSGETKYSGDERFIEYPEALKIELNAVKKAKEDYDCRNLSISFPFIRSVKNLLDLKSIVSANNLRRSTLTKFYAEVAIPSFVNDFDNLPDDVIDGIIINYDMLLKLTVFRNEIRSVDHDILIDMVSKLIKKCRRRKLDYILNIDRTDNYVLEKINSIMPDAIIFANIPREEEIEILIKKQAERLVKKTETPPLHVNL